MAGGTNRKRNHKKTPEGHTLWGSLFDPIFRTEEMKKGGTIPPHPEEDDDDDNPAADTAGSLLRRLWHRFNIWTIVSVSLFLCFTTLLAITLVNMWRPQDLSDIAGYGDTAAARDLTAVIRSANGAPVTITEAELNRYLRDTCRMRQTGIFSIITHGQGVAVRVHDGYAELILDRIMGANMHQTTAVNLTFSTENRLGTPELRIELRGGESLAGTAGTGGSIGKVNIPQRHILMLKPALESLLTCYPEIVELIRRHHYCPVFTAGGSKENRSITLIPHNAE